ncbi:hypothetical protein [Streptococcus anginosus]|uniref:hypothetical protein n=1 Tax=Streptococcus anginosus TaxID=1328 RepID=UPI001247A938|nr:hypothetical protein [Streptococcus anginosus]KAA9307411.1 hypothetical protein F6I00_00305 [Streptococcus anginosus]MED5940464.1 hypothetical protein [Streptococcus anginosus]MED5942124.1 hypothetical protein [Streptococcus anginosus]MED5971330.1 hypothetical protein [Streptococcus anginosus]
MRKQVTFYRLLTYMWRYKWIKLALQKLKESPKADKSFNVLSDFRISKSTVHTSGVIAWVCLN